MLRLFKNSEPGDKPGWFDRLKGGLAKTRTQLGGLFAARRIDESLFEELETALLSADAGVAATEHLITELRKRARKNRLENAEQLKSELHELMVEILSPLEVSIDCGAHRPLIIMVAGVNGAGKTTSIGKLTHLYQRQGHTVLLAAGDTFRAAAREQLAEWGKQNGVTVVSQQSGDPAAVIFDAIQAARARNIGIVLADTAGRLPTQMHLMEEVRKIKRVIRKADEHAPHHVWLVIDANTGQNAVNQVRAFDEAIGLTGIILTKLDGTAKGGVVAAIALARSNQASAQADRGTRQSKDAPVQPIPIAYVGLGEGLDDLRPFVAREFVSALLD
ncbi:MAG: signal recognition particle-docking protein FtsY [Betaproteobacteria bacterium RIFCSPLOWO2_12_FULL_63_13]|nr:MAG: signal recognition particle-docking protein FtsY [Betaproteobacteria bacterium RIFCSPLOWO2_12_FULL_63_13]